MTLRPVPAFFEAPAVDDIADQIEIVAIVIDEKIMEQFGLAAARAKMDIGNPNCAVSITTRCHIIPRLL